MKEVLSYLLAIGGLIVVLTAVIPAYAHFVAYREARALLINLLRQQPNRVAKVCRGAPGTFYEAIAGAIKAASSIGTSDPAIVPTATRPGYDAAAIGITHALKALFGRAKLGVMAAAGGAAISISLGANKSYLVIICAGLAVAGIAAVAYRRSEVGREILLARAEVLPEVDRAFVERRLP